MKPGIITFDGSVLTIRYEDGKAYSVCPSADNIVLLSENFARQVRALWQRGRMPKYEDMS